MYGKRPRSSSSYRPSFGNFTSAYSFYPKRTRHTSFGSIPSIGLSSGWSQTQLNKSSNGSSGAGVTSQYDRKTIYRKKRMPRRKRRQWVKFVRKVRSAMVKEIGSNTIVRNSQMTYASADNLQGFFTATLYGKDGTDTSLSVGNRDLVDIFNNDSRLAKQTARAKFTTAILDLTVTNNSTIIDGTNQNTSVELDVYEIYWNKKVDGTSPNQHYNVAAVSTEAINTAVPGLDLTVRGTTPFEFPDASAKGAKIYKKTKFLLGAGQVFTYQMKVLKNTSVRRDMIDDGDDNFAFEYRTKTLLMVVKGVPTGDATKVLKSVQLGVTRKYMYKIIDVNQDADNVI